MIKTVNIVIKNLIIFIQIKKITKINPIFLIFNQYCYKLFKKKNIL